MSVGFVVAVMSLCNDQSVGLFFCLGDNYDDVNIRKDVGVYSLRWLW